MSIANLWKRKDAKLRTLDADSVMVAGCQKSRNSKELSILFAILKSKRLTILFLVKGILPKVQTECMSKKICKLYQKKNN